MTQVWSIDAETHSEVDLRAFGADVYSRHAGTRCLMLAFHPVGHPDRPQLWIEGDPVPYGLIGHIANSGLFAGWNVVGFDRLIYSRILVPKHGFPPIDDDNWRDSMHLAAHANLPRSLDGCGSAVGVPFDNQLKDTNRIRRITDAKRTEIPDTVRAILDNPAEYSNKLVDDLQWLAARCVQDVEMEEQVLLRLPPWPDVEPWLKMPAIDRRINDRGVRMDVQLVEGLHKAGVIETARLDVEMAKVTDGAVPKTTNVESLKQWLIDNGVELPDARAKSDDDEDDDDIDRKSPWRLRKSDMADILARTDVPDKCRLAVAMRAEAAKASARKLKTMLACATPEGRLHGTMILMGAQASGRFSSGRTQLHNMVRDVVASFEDVAATNNLDPKADKDKILRLMPLALSTAISAGRTGDPDLLRMLYEAPRKDLQGRSLVQGVLPWISRMSRRTLCVAASQIMFSGDYANVEARIPVWLAEQEDVVEQFRRGEDVYRAQAAPIYGQSPDSLSYSQRQVGKCCRLFLGFAGGVNAFIPAAMNYGVLVPREEALGIVKTFRETNSKLVEYWDANLQAARWAVTYPGHEFAVPPKGIVSWRMIDNCLLCRLPSGRYLRYWAPYFEQGYWEDGSPKSELDLKVIFVKGKLTKHRTLWRGLAIENQVQAIAADMLCAALVNMDREELPVVLHVHDSVAVEADEDQADVLLPQFKAAMLDMPEWTTGLPVAADCHYGPRFG